MADRYESSQDDPDRKGKPDKRKQENKQYVARKFATKETQHAEGKQQQKTNGKEKRKFLGNCYVCEKAGHRAQDCYKKAAATDGKGKANVAQGGPKQEKE